MIYHYNPQTKEYIGQSEMEFDPIGHEPMIPAYATVVEVPQFKEQEIPVFEDNRWVVKPDFRGTKYWIDHDTEKEIKEIGEVIPDDAYREQPEHIETEDKLLRQQVVEAQYQLDATDYAVVKCYDLGLVFADEYPELHEQRKVWRQTIRDARDEN